MINNSQIVIKKNVLDIHPLQAYLKLCSFIDTYPDKQILNMFSSTSFSDYLSLSIKTPFLPFLREINSQFLKK
jgi:hypothetical protein